MYFSFQHEISDKLWETIKNNYESENYTGAIMDGLFLIAEIIRERSDLEYDGVSLVGRAFGGNEPLLKINKFQTENEKNQQKGIESILRGIFQAVRNPRAHEKFNDDKETCDTFIIFFNYLVNIIEKSKTKFEIKDFCNRIFDQDFVESNEYADLLTDEIPKKKMFDTLMVIWKKRDKISPKKFHYVFNSFSKKLTKEEYKEFTSMVSNLLKITNEEHDFRIITELFNEERWENLSLSARLRAENKLIKSFEKGIFDSQNNNCKSGSLGTWITNILEYIHMKDHFNYTLTKKLSSEDYEEVEYIFHYFRNYILNFDEEPNSSIISAINKGLERGDKRFYDLVSAEFIFSDNEWLKKIEENYNNFEERDLAPYFDVPF